MIARGPVYIYIIVYLNVTLLFTFVLVHYQSGPQITEEIRLSNEEVVLRHSAAKRDGTLKFGHSHYTVVVSFWTVC